MKDNTKEFFKMKTNIKKTKQPLVAIIAIVMLVTDFFGALMPVRAAENKYAIVQDTVYAERRTDSSEMSRKRSLFEYVAMRMSSDKKLTVSAIKYAEDFAGNKYTVIECSPEGYMIFCETSGVFVEYSATSLSPYLNRNGDIYYCGPTYYYEKVGRSELEHTLLKNESINVKEISGYADECNAFVKYNLEQKNEVVLNYIRNGNEKESFSDYAGSGRLKAKANSSGHVAHESFFADMKSPCGYFSYTQSNTICGYIGLAMTIAYRDCYTDDRYMDDTFWADHNKTLSEGRNSFGAMLRKKHGTRDSLNAAEIKAVSESYFKSIGLSVNHTAKSWGFFNRNTIMNAIDNDDPVLLVGSFVNPQNTEKKLDHVVVAYAYTNQGGFFGETVYTAHFGLDNYSQVHVSGSIGSIYILH